MTDTKFILAGTLLTSASEPVLKDWLIRIRGDLVESVESAPEAMGKARAAERKYWRAVGTA